MGRNEQTGQKFHRILRKPCRNRYSQRFCVRNFYPENDPKKCRCHFPLTAENASTFPKSYETLWRFVRFCPPILSSSHSLNITVFMFNDTGRKRKAQKWVSGDNARTCGKQKNSRGRESILGACVGTRYRRASSACSRLASCRFFAACIRFRWTCFVSSCCWYMSVRCSSGRRGCVLAVLGMVSSLFLLFDTSSRENLH